jgi:hypothetical protein
MGSHVFIIFSRPWKRENHGLRVNNKKGAFVRSSMPQYSNFLDHERASLIKRHHEKGLEKLLPRI